jgi:hypothetical protein
MHRDLMAMKSGARQDGFVFHGKALSQGSKRLQAGDYQIAFGDPIAPIGAAHDPTRNPKASLAPIAIVLELRLDQDAIGRSEGFNLLADKW